MALYVLRAARTRNLQRVLHLPLVDLIANMNIGPKWKVLTKEKMLASCCTSSLHVCHWSIMLFFLPPSEPNSPHSLTEMFAYAASPATVCTTSSTSVRLRHQKSMSMSASVHMKMMLPPVNNGTDNFRSM